MPETITSFTTYAASTTAKSSEVNDNFSNYRGTYLPIAESASAATTLAYDAGTTEYIWSGLYTKSLQLRGLTTTADILFTSNNTSTTGSLDILFGSSTVGSFGESGYKRRTIAPTPHTTASALDGQILLSNTLTVSTDSASSTEFTIGVGRITFSTATTSMVGLVNSLIHIEDTQSSQPNLDELEGKIIFMRGATTTGLTTLGAYRIGNLAQANTDVPSQVHALKAPGPFLYFDNSATSGENVYQISFQMVVFDAPSLSITGQFLAKEFL